ncbi:MAG: DUF4350 domain-containing protein [Archaeoglobaceae archaeon]|nr:DUF4350 domain-containing protein [Archaeoglobaceae archaeon]MCX8151424.1 DUF4350 domain-containing protein [Archaeoglobaceae archaeon]MDW8014367.1 DUF4350 domain-containing protein [Archaeoglobaceae archaeon]
MNPTVYAFMILFGTALLILPIAIPLIKSSADLSIFNTDWNGLSEFAKLCLEKRKVVPILYPYNSIKLSEKEGVLLIVSPNLDFSLAEVEEIKAFLEKGGTVFIADDSGLSNSLLEKLGVKARFSGKIRDIFYDKNENFPFVVRIDGEISRGLEKIKLNVPSAILGVEGDVKTSKASFVEEMRSYTILAELDYGNGKIILFSDPSSLMNEMIDQNRQFALNLIDLLGSGTFYFDEAHRADLNPYSVATVYIQRDLNRDSAFLVLLFVAAFSLLSPYLSSLTKILRFFEKIFPSKLSLEDLPLEKEKLEEMLRRMNYAGEVEKRNK